MAKHGADPDAAPVNHHRVRRVLVILGVVMATLVVAGTAGAYLIYRDLDNNISREDLLNSEVLGSDRPTKVVETDSDLQPLNILVMGSDTREGQGKGFGNAAGARSDTTMLVHISGDRSRMEVVSIPRDSIVDVPSCKTATGVSEPFRDRFNAAFSVGGPGCTIKTVEQDTGVYIDHFVVVDFRGFENMIDAIGKVRVCLPEAVNDPLSKLNLPAGFSEVDGKEALAYVRARHIGNGSDISRIDRQQAFASSVISKVTSAGVLLNPAKLLGFLRAATSSITTDPQLGSLNQMRELAQQVRGIPPKNVTFVTAPWVTNPEDPNTVIWDPTKAPQLWEALKNDTPYPPPAPKPAVIDGSAITAAPDTISVSVLNGTPKEGKAAKVGEKLGKQGYQVVAVDNADSSTYTSTVIRYDPAYGADAARTLAAALPGASRVKVAGLGSTVQVVVGQQFGGVDEVSVLAPPDPNEHIRKASQNICS